MCEYTVECVCRFSLTAQATDGYQHFISAPVSIRINVIIIYLFEISIIINLYVFLARIIEKLDY